MINSAFGLGLAWVNNYNTFSYTSSGPDMAVDRDGAIYVASSNQDSNTGHVTEILVTKYLSNGDIAWTNSIPSDGWIIGGVHNIAFDSLGNTYLLVGTFYPDVDSLKNRIDCIIMKYDSEGNFVWGRTYLGLNHTQNRPVGLLVDNIGNCYMSCMGDTAYDELGAYSNTTIKYNSNGDVIWIRHYADTIPGVEYFNNLIFDAQGNILILGATIKDEMLIKYSPAGDVISSRSYSNPDSLDIGDYCLAMDLLGNIYVIGTAYSTSIPMTYYHVTKYDPTGELVWQRLYGGLGGTRNFPTSFVVDDDGDVFVTGISEMDTMYAGNFECATIKYNTNGDLIWEDRSFMYISSHAQPKLAADNEGNAFLLAAGNSVMDCFSGYRSTLIRFAPDGTRTTLSQYKGESDYNIITSDLVIDEADNIYVSGIGGSGTHYDNIFVLKYSSSLPLCSISGKIVNDASLPIADVTVKLGPNHQTITDNNGNYSFSNIEPNMFDLAYYFSNTGIFNCTSGYLLHPGANDTVNGVLEYDCHYRPGDINGDSIIGPGDVTYGVRFFKGIGPVPLMDCYSVRSNGHIYVAGDVNGDCEFRGSDITCLVAYFKGISSLSYCPTIPPTNRH